MNDKNLYYFVLIWDIGLFMDTVSGPSFNAFLTQKISKVVADNVKRAASNMKLEETLKPLKQ